MIKSNKIAFSVVIFLAMVIFSLVGVIGYKKREKSADEKAEMKKSFEDTADIIPRSLMYQAQNFQNQYAEESETSDKTAHTEQTTQKRAPDREKKTTQGKRRQINSYPNYSRPRQEKNRELDEAKKAGTRITLKDYHASTQGSAYAASSPAPSELSEIAQIAQILSKNQKPEPEAALASPVKITRQLFPADADLPPAHMRDEYREQNNQIRKENFASADNSNEIIFPRRLPLTKYQVSAGSVVPCILQSGINSDIPGMITALVSQNVYDSPKGKHLLIPQGTKVTGLYSSDVSFGQTRVLVIFNKLFFPDGSSANIGKMQGYEQEGYAGFSDKVDRHFFRMFGSAILLSIIATGVHAIKSDNPTKASEAFSDSAAEHSMRLGDALLQKHLNVQPTIKIRPGFKFNITVGKTLFFKTSY